MEKKDVPSLKKSSPELIIKDDYLQHWAYMLAMRTDREHFDDLLVRRAMNMAVDRQAILNTVFGGEGVILNNPIPADGPESVFTPLEKMPKKFRRILSITLSVRSSCWPLRATRTVSRLLCRRLH